MSIFAVFQKNILNSTADSVSNINS